MLRAYQQWREGIGRLFDDIVQCTLLLSLGSCSDWSHCDRVLHRDLQALLAFPWTGALHAANMTLLLMQDQPMSIHKKIFMTKELLSGSRRPNGRYDLIEAWEGDVRVLQNCPRYWFLG